MIINKKSTLIPSIFNIDFLKYIIILLYNKKIFLFSKHIKHESNGISKNEK